MRRRHLVLAATVVQGLMLGACVYDWSSSSGQTSSSGGSSTSAGSTVGASASSSGSAGCESTNCGCMPAEHGGCNNLGAQCSIPSPGADPNDPRFECHETLGCQEKDAGALWYLIQAASCDGPLAPCDPSPDGSCSGGYCLSDAGGLCTCWYQDSPSAYFFVCEQVDGGGADCPPAIPAIGTYCPTVDVRCDYALCPAPGQCDAGAGWNCFDAGNEFGYRTCSPSHNWIGANNSCTSNMPP